MAKKRSKADKIRARERLKNAVKPETKQEKLLSSTQAPEKSINSKASDLFHAELKYIKQDLRKTGLVTLVVLVVLALITLRYT
ncbi:MAG: hypothetical protein GX559_01825 [Candidatus Pacebacteria bacterium]|nr:hypothetical protein [Candidatus Paceibacterota bacterium]